MARYCLSASVRSFMSFSWSAVIICDVYLFKILCEDTTIFKNKQIYTRAKVLLPHWQIRFVDKIFLLVLKVRLSCCTFAAEIEWIL